MQFARIANGVVVEIGTFAAAPVMHPSLLWVQIDGQPNAAQIAVGWTYNVAANPSFAAPVPTLAQAQVAATLAAQMQYQALIAAGFTWNGTLYQIDPVSVQNLTGMGALATATLTAGSGAVWPAGFSWIAANNALVAMTAVQLLAFASAVAGYVSGLVMNLRALKTAIAAAADVPAVQGINIAGGWPAAAGP